MCPIQLPGRENRFSEPPFTQLFSLNEQLAYALIPYLDMPFAFFGHSMGALISFELSRYLCRNMGHIPKHLFVSAHRAPQLSDSNSSIYTLPESSFLEKIRHLNGIPAEILDNPELLQLFLPILRADFTLCETYRYQPEIPLPCAITAFGGLRDETLLQQDLDAWRQQTQSTFRLHYFAGNHFFLHESQATLLNILASELLSSI